MGITPIERLKHWFADLAEGKPRPYGRLSCAACRGDVPDSGGIWFSDDGVAVCSDDCAADWQVDRAY